MMRENKMRKTYSIWHMAYIYIHYIYIHKHIFNNTCIYIYIYILGVAPSQYSSGLNESV